jgi:potassium/hydrogen antiporter
LSSGKKKGDRLQSIALIVASVGLVVFLAHLFTGIFERTRIPDVILLLAVGIILGPITGLVLPSKLGNLGNVFATITLVIILFEGGTTLKINTLRSTFVKAIWLAILSFLLTMGITTVSILWLTDLNLLAALILGAIVASTSESIVIPLIRQMKIHEKSQAILALESSINDVLSIVITLALIATNKAGTISVSAIGQKLLASFLVAIVFGVAGALIWSILRLRINSLKGSMFTTPAFLFIIYGVVELIGFNGAIAALAFGITFGNVQLLPISIFKKYLTENKDESQPTIGLSQTERSIFSEIAFLLKSFFFIYVGISLKFTGTEAMLVGLVIVIFAFILRLPTVKLVSGKGTSPRDASVMSIMIPKGLAAIVLASIPLSEGIIGGEQIMDITYTTVLFSIIITTILVFAIDRTALGKIYAWIFSIGHKPTGNSVAENNSPPSIPPAPPESPTILLPSGRQDSPTTKD